MTVLVLKLHNSIFFCELCRLHMKQAVEKIHPSTGCIGSTAVLVVNLQNMFFFGITVENVPQL